AGGRPVAGRHDARVRPRRCSRVGGCGVPRGTRHEPGQPEARGVLRGAVPQFIPRGAPVLPNTLAMTAVILAVDLVWYSTLAVLVVRARRAFTEGGWGRRIERLTGAVLIGLGIRLALERR